MGGRVPFWHNFFPKEKTQVFHSGVDGFSVTCEGGELCWRPMVTTHWPKLLHHYGYDTENRWAAHVHTSHRHMMTSYDVI